MVLCTRFDPQPKGVSFFSDAKRYEAYFCARPFLQEQMRLLLEDGWKRNDWNSEQFLFNIYKPSGWDKGLQSRRGELRIILPKSFSDFLDLSKTNTWGAIFENPAIFNARKRGNNNKLDLYIGNSLPLSNIFYLLQVLAPGMLVIYHEYQLLDADVKVSRILPRAKWINDNIEVMSKTDALLAAANDRKIAFHEERTARPQNNSHYSSMPGMDAGPATVKNQKNAPQKKKTTQAQNIPNYSSLPGTDAVPATTKDQKPKPQKKKTAQPQINSHHSSLPGTDALPAAAKDQKQKQKQKPAPQKNRKGRSQNSVYSVTPGYLNSMDDYSQGYEWGVCDKDCGWCGRCTLNF